MAEREDVSAAVRPRLGSVVREAADVAEGSGSGCVVGEGADRSRRLGEGHGFGGWWMCGCDRRIPSHADVAADPAGGGGCGMTWRVCSRCDHVDERHVTARPGPEPGPSVAGGPGVVR